MFHFRLEELNFIWKLYNIVRYGYNGNIYVADTIFVQRIKMFMYIWYYDTRPNNF